jgi:alpha,alpha-trehalase
MRSIGGGRTGRAPPVYVILAGVEERTVTTHLQPAGADVGPRARENGDVMTPYTLRDYTLLADGLRGAVLSPEGEVAWLCFPTWSDPALFAGLLGGGGTYVVVPSIRHVRGGYYEPGSMVWRQRWITADGVVEVREALAHPGRPGRAVVLRRIRALDGRVPMLVRLEMAPDYGRRRSEPWKRIGESWTTVLDGGLHARWSGVPEAVPTRRRGPGLEALLDIAPERPRDLVLEIDQHEFTSGAPTPEPLWNQTEQAWSKAVPRCDDVESREDVRQSYVVLRSLTTPDGATVAAATTSLPERAEAGRNYDYRYAWVRDTCYIGQAGAALAGGEAMLDDAVRWACGRVLTDGDRTSPAYRVDGLPVPTPSHLGLPGYPGGSDVVGNRVSSQFQLDLFGEVLLLLAKAMSKDRLDAEGWRAAEVAVQAIERRHGEREAGIWEIEPNHWAHSQLLCVAGLRGIAEAGAPPRWKVQALSLADHLLSKVDRTCLHSTGRWQRAPDDERVDASLLLAEVRGAVPASDPRSAATRRAVLSELNQQGYIYRYADPGTALGDEEGAFLICNFWMALAHLKAGDRPSAAQWFERTKASSGTSGLFSEEYDVAKRQLRGNLPQAFVHALLIECAGRLHDA